MVPSLHLPPSSLQHSPLTKGAASAARKVKRIRTCGWKCITGFRLGLGFLSHPASHKYLYSHSRDYIAMSFIEMDCNVNPQAPSPGPYVFLHAFATSKNFVWWSMRSIALRYFTHSPHRRTSCGGVWVQQPYVSLHIEGLLVVGMGPTASYLT